MRLLTRYLLIRQIRPFAIVALALTGLVWMVLGARELHLLPADAPGFWLWMQLIFYRMPAVLVESLPAALFAALVYVLASMIFFNSEASAMFAAGLSRLAFAKSFLLFAAAVGLALLVLNLYGEPWRIRETSLKRNAIRSDLVPSILRTGAFTSLGKNVTIFVRSRSREGIIRGILIHEARRPETQTTYIAETGALVRSGPNARLVMFNGQIHYQDRRARNGGVTILSFDKYAYDLASLDSGGRPGSLRAEALYPHQLLAGQATDIAPKEQRKRSRILHGRLSSPIYCLVYAMIALAAMLGGSFNRRGASGRIILAAVAAIGARLVQAMTETLATANPAAIPLMHLLPVAIMLACIPIIAGWHRPRPRTGRSTLNPAAE